MLEQIAAALDRKATERKLRTVAVCAVDVQLWKRVCKSEGRPESRA